MNKNANKTKFMESVVESLPIAGEIYRVNDCDGGVKVAFYDHFKDYGNYKFVMTFQTEFSADELQGLVGRTRPIPR